MRLNIVFPSPSIEVRVSNIVRVGVAQHTVVVINLTWVIAVVK